MTRQIPLTAIDDYQSGMSSIEVAEKYRASATGICDMLRRNGVKCRGSRNFIDAEELQIAHIYRAGHSARAIARAYSVSKTCILAALKRQGVKQRSPAERTGPGNTGGRLYLQRCYNLDG